MRSAGNSLVKLRFRLPNGPIWLVFLLIFFNACSTDPVLVDSRFQHEIYVLALLSNAAAHQSVRVQRTGALTQPPQAVEDATVSIRDSRATYRLSHVGGGLYRDVETPIPIRAGETYFLQINLPGQETIRAQTTVPQQFQILIFPAADTLVLQKEIDPSGLLRYSAPLNISWSPNQAILTRLRETIFYSQSQDRYYDDCYSVSSGRTLRQDFLLRTGSSADDRPLKARFYVTQLDSIFAAYTFLNSYNCFDLDIDENPKNERAMYLLNWRQRIDKEHVDVFNVQGAKGVFGSVWVDSVQVYFKLEGN